jgi:hypothetical protein
MMAWRSAPTRDFDVMITGSSRFLSWSQCAKVLENLGGTLSVANPVSGDAFKMRR